uniref:Glutamate racemase n=1 Tax=Candidatus Aschnera chinzeii TaxID=1485666 RepID=A0AAT9G3U5_9ENTR|nr:MAG: glutamate racemase [Candidatus Aschnera chinzeii]
MNIKVVNNINFILILDSGVGGISIFNEIKQLLPNINYIYCLDNFAFPYGEKDESFIINRLLTLINKICKIHKLCMVILACNTASVVGLSALQLSFPFLILGIKPVIELATRITRNSIIGLLATKTTINSIYIKRLIKKLSSSYTIKVIIAPQLVLLAEKKMRGHYISKNLILPIIDCWLYETNVPDTIILGCTHFSHLIAELKNIFLKNIILLDGNLILAKTVFSLLQYENKLFINIHNNIVYYTKFDFNIFNLQPIFKKLGFDIFKIINI